MGDTILKVGLDELATVRVTCKKCGIVVEAPAADVGRTFYNGDCKHCGAVFFNPHGTHRPFGTLSEGLRQVSALGDVVDVEFVLPVSK